ncbi:hypothetical protein Igag_0870 [Ignisphaera aggregans DSM 17230]|uniref:Uncharacterized protein n=1 Tax=Ignisphaera aggregans (strain DSM 17230 / JCM 13409 / AQ1.S1) TaxID=583356 RepID=E0STS1_IGNAA|nr:hypothetical protein Igag_0870 [Ignisphaera aggregans DSM 17230]
MRLRIVLEIAIRITIAFVLWEYIAKLYNLLTGFDIYMFMHMDIESKARFILMSLASVFALVSLITANITLFIATIVIGSIAEGLAGSTPIYIALVYLPIVLSLDTIKNLYRDGQEKGIRIDMKKMVLGAIYTIVIVGVSMFIAYLSARYIATLTTPIPATSSRLAFAITTNPLYLLAIATAISIILYMVTTSLFDIAITYIYPSRQIALKTLLNRDDIDINLVPPLSTIKSFVIASIIAPLLYAAIYSSILDRIASQYIANQILLLVIRVFVAIIIFISIGLIFNRIEKGLSYNPKTIFLTSIAILLLIYGAAVYGSYAVYRDPIYSFLHPDISMVTQYASSIYHNYYILFIEFIEIIPKLFGAVP